MLSFLLLIAVVSAVGVTSFYWNGDNEQPLYLAPGETKDIYFELQNMVGDSDVTFKAQIINGSDIAQIIDKNDVYQVPAGTKDTRVNVKVSAPVSAKSGERFNVGLTFTTVTANTGGFTFGSAFDKYFDLIIVAEKTQEKQAGTGWIIYALIGLIILIIIIILVTKSRQK